MLANQSGYEASVHPAACPECCKRAMGLSNGIVYCVSETIYSLKQMPGELFAFADRLWGSCRDTICGAPQQRRPYATGLRYHVTELAYMLGRCLAIVFGPLASMPLIMLSICTGQESQRGSSSRRDREARAQAGFGAPRNLSGATAHEAEINHRLCQEIAGIDKAIQSGRGHLPSLLKEREALLYKQEQMAKLISLADNQFQLANDRLRFLLGELLKLMDRWDRGDNSPALETAIHAVEREIAAVQRDLHRGGLDV